MKCLFLIFCNSIIIFLSMTDNQSIGIMEGAFFVPKGEILSWAN